MEKIINRYKLKDGIKMDDILSELKERRIPRAEGGSYVNRDAYYVFWHTLVDDIEVNIALPEDLSKWDDFDFVLVLDDSFGQPYVPFYEHKGEPFVYLLNVIGNYNKFMDSLNFLERKEEE